MRRLPALLRTTTFRITMMAAGLFALSAFAMLGFVYETTAGALTRQTDGLLNEQINIAKLTFNARGTNGVNRFVVQHSTGKDPYLYVFTYPNGRFISGNLSGLPKSMLKPGKTHRFSYQIRPAGAKDPVSHRAQGRLILFPGGYKLLVGRDVEENARIVDRIARALWIAAASVIALGLFSGVILSRRFLARLDALNAVAIDVMSGELHRRAPRNYSGDELDELAANLNAMLAQIEKLMEATRHTGDSIAHDLRAPLTRIRNRLEANLQAPDGEAKEALAQTLKDMDQILTTFNAVLRIARLEAGEQRQALSPLDPAPLVHDMGDMFAPVCEDSGLELLTETQEGLTIRADQGLLAQAISNLLDNAIKYTPAGGAIALRLRKRSDERVEISITDTGPGVPAEQREAILGRFVRLEESRSQPGSGLGLALVKAVADFHGAALELAEGAGSSDGKGEGLRVALVFPRVRKTRQKHAEKRPKMTNSDR